MIFVNIKNASLYSSMHEKFAEAFEFLKNYKDGSLPKGKHELDGDNLYAVIQEYTIAPDKTGIFEGHEKYIDIQYIVSGIEKIGVVNVERAIIDKKYDESIDAALYSGSPDAFDLLLKAGDFAVLYPEDIHRPGMPATCKSEDIKKIVVKVKI